MHMPLAHTCSRQEEAEEDAEEDAGEDAGASMVEPCSLLIHEVPDEVADEAAGASMVEAFTQLQPIPGGTRKRSMAADFSRDVEVDEVLTDSLKSCVLRHLTDWLKFCVLRHVVKL